MRKTEKGLVTDNGDKKKENEERAENGNIGRY